MPETRDSSFKWSDFEEKVNGVLVANLGNFVHRVLSISKGFDESGLSKLDTLDEVKEKEDSCRIIETELTLQRDRLSQDRAKAEKYQKLRTEYLSGTIVLFESTLKGTTLRPTSATTASRTVMTAT